MLFHCLDGYAKAIGYFCLGDLVNLVHYENCLAARGESGDGIDEPLEFLLSLIPAHGGSGRAGYLWEFADSLQPSGLAAFATIAAHGGVVSDFPQESQGRTNVLFFTAFKQLQAHVMHDITCRAPVTEASANVIDEVVVVTDQCRQQRRFDGIERHNAPRKRAKL
ncbi:hypothetical protein D3C76_562600 [compost metagenome]